MEVRVIVSPYRVEKIQITNNLEVDKVTYFGVHLQAKQYSADIIKS